MKPKTLLFLFLIALALVLPSCGKPSATPTVTPTSTEIEATEFMGTKLTPIKEQRNNAFSGTQIIDKATYILTFDGLVDNPLKLTYNDLLAYPQISKLMDLNA
jgi:DMSO/TMAO reductase YedYZ molybdopterin-dependent catalytic subunit